jgi:transposase InsO family protein
VFGDILYTFEVEDVAMPWAGSVMDQRLAFVLVVRSGVSVSEACRRFSVSRPTGHKWLARFDDEGLEGLVDRSRRPRVSPDRTSPEFEELVVAVRRRFPAWGGRKIRAFLIRQGHESPAASTITRILARHGLIATAQPRQRNFVSFEAAAPNETWQIDFKGHFGLVGGQRCHPLGILDDHSRFNLSLGACRNQQTATVKAQLMEAFVSYGLPARLLADNGPPWGSSNPGFRWTPLKVWLADVGVPVVHSRPRHPQTLGKEERFHLTLIREVLTPQRQWRSFPQIQGAFDEWRNIYNQHRPHQSLNDGVPADRYTPSPRPFPKTIKPPQYPEDWTTHRVDASASILIRRQAHKIGKAFIGKTIAIDPQTHIAYYRDHPIRAVNHVPERV